MTPRPTTPPLRNPMSGTLTRAMTGELREPREDGDVLPFTAAPGADGTLRLTGTAGHTHWSGSLAADRASWTMRCRFGFSIWGAAVFEGGVYRLQQTGWRMPEELALPGEALERVVENKSANGSFHRPSGGENALTMEQSV